MERRSHSWENRKKSRPLVEDFKLPQMAQEYTMRGFTQGEIDMRRTEIKQKTQQAWFYECEGWEKDDIAEASNPSLNRGR